MIEDLGNVQHGEVIWSVHAVQLIQKDYIKREWHMFSVAQEERTGAIEYTLQENADLA